MVSFFCSYVKGLDVCRAAPVPSRAQDLRGSCATPAGSQIVRRSCAARIRACGLPAARFTWWIACDLSRKGREFGGIGWRVDPHDLEPVTDLKRGQVRSRISTRPGDRNSSGHQSRAPLAARDLRGEGEGNGGRGQGVTSTTSPAPDHAGSPPTQRLLRLVGIL